MKHQHDYTVTWTINVYGKNKDDAIKQALNTLKDQLRAENDAFEPIFEVKQTCDVDYYIKNAKKYEWICTDSNIEQYGRKITDKIFEFKEKGKGPYIINLDEYSNQDIESCINTYGYTQYPIIDDTNKLSYIRDVYKNESNWIIAECLFEQDND